MRRTNDETKPTGTQSTDYPQTIKPTHRILITVVLVFVLAGVSGITAFMCFLMPQQHLQQIGEDFFTTLRTAETGESVFFGTYEQDNDLTDGAEPIEWEVLDRQGNRVLLLSKYVLDHVSFNTSSRISTWDRSSVRSWLNETFYLTAFSTAEQSVICLSDITPDRNPDYDADPGKTTGSRVFILNLTETYKYLPSARDRLCAPTRFAVAQGAVSQSGVSSWWLRSTGYDVSAASCILPDGGLSFIGRPAEYKLGIRPAIWVECADVFAA